MKYVGSFFIFGQRRQCPRKTKTTKLLYVSFKYVIKKEILDIRLRRFQNSYIIWIFIKTKISQPINTSISLAPCVLKSNIVSKIARSLILRTKIGVCPLSLQLHVTISIRSLESLSTMRWVKPSLFSICIPVYIPHISTWRAWRSPIL